MPKGHNKEREIKRIDALIETIDQFSTSYIFNDVQSNAVGFAEKSYFYPDLDNLVNFFNDNEKDVSTDSNISD